MWWEKYDGVPDFPRLKITQDEKIRHRPQWGVNRVVVEKNQDKLLTGTLGTVGWGGNSGFHALNLAVQFGAVKVILVGYDMRCDKGLHWHGAHVKGLNNPTPRNVERWRRVTDDAAPVLKALGVEVINTSAVSALRNFPKMGLREALGC